MSICVLSRWPFICFQITEERQDPGVGGRGRKHNCNMWSPVSRQNDFVRRLVCTLLSSCGQYFSKGSVGRRLDAFLASFQRYVLSKPPLPLHVEFDVQVSSCLGHSWLLNRPQPDSISPVVDIPC